MSNQAQFNDIIYRLDVTTYGNLTKVTDTISKCRVRIFYKGLNRNRTYISDDFADQLISSLPYAPIKGIFNYSEEDFEDHGKDNTDGKIYGIIPEKNNFAWEKHLDEDGIEREYATSDVYLFTGLYPEAQLIPGKSQSMEIFKVTLEGEWKIWEDGKPYFHFYKGSLVGLQTLGKDVEPCFEGSAFFSLCKDLQDCVNYIKQVDKINKKEEGEKMDTTLFRLSDNEKAEAIFDAINPNFNEENVRQVDYYIIEVYDDYALCRKKEEAKCTRVYYTKDGDNISIGEMVDVKIVDVTESEYSALETMKAMNGTYEAVNEAYSNLENKINGLETEKTTYASQKEELENEKSILENKLTEAENNVTTLSDSISEKATKIEQYESQISDLNAEKVRLEKEKNDIINENKSLKTFKKNVETEKKTAIINEFSSHLTDEQIENFKSKMDDFEVSDFKKEICTAAYDTDPTIFSQKDDNGYIFKGGNPEGKSESGVIRLLNKYKNGGNK